MMTIGVIAVVISGFGFVAAAILARIEIRRSSVGQMSAVQRSTDEQPARKSEAMGQLDAVEASSLRTDLMTQLVQDATQLENAPSLVFEFAQAEIHRLSKMLKTVSEGSDVTYEGEDRDWLLGLSRAAQTSVDATSLTTLDVGGRGFVDGSLWTSDLGQRYLDEQKKAVERGVAIRRLFIIDRPELLRDPGFASICRLHNEIGVHVKVLNPTNIPATMPGALSEFVIFDGAISYQTTTLSRIGEPTRPAVINTQLVTSPQTVQDQIRRFDYLWSLAERP